MYKLNELKFYDLIMESSSNEHNHWLKEKLVPSYKNMKVKDFKNYQLNSLLITNEMYDMYDRYHRCMYITISKVKDKYLLAFSSCLPNNWIGIFAVSMYNVPHLEKVNSNVMNFK